MPKFSIIIPTLGRPELDRCIESIKAQTYKDYEIILIRDRGPLARLRNEGAKRAKGKWLAFIDDDILCSERWLEAKEKIFNGYLGISGVSGPCPIPDSYRRNRDLFRFKIIYDWFQQGKHELPGHILDSGAWTTGASEHNCVYEGPVHFLEACNMTFTKEVFERVGGFDEQYRGIGDWSEPDLSFRIRELGHCLWFTRDALVYHLPSPTRSFKAGESTKDRITNYELFSRRWIKPSFQHTAYKWFIRLYYFAKERKLI